MLNKKDNKSIFAATFRKSNTKSKFITQEWNIFCGRGNFLIAVYLHLCNLFGGEIEIQLLIRFFEMIFASVGLGHFSFSASFTLTFCLQISVVSFGWYCTKSQSSKPNKKLRMWFEPSKYQSIQLLPQKRALVGEGLCIIFLSPLKTINVYIKAWAGNNWRDE